MNAYMCSIHVVRGTKYNSRWETPSCYVEQEGAGRLGNALGRWVASLDVHKSLLLALGSYRELWYAGVVVLDC